MMPVGLIPDEWLVSYAAGSLTDAQALLVATHVDYHADLGAKVADAEALGGVLMEDMAPAEPGNLSFESLMASIDCMPESTDEAEPALRGDEDIPSVLRRYLGKPLDELKWRFMAPGMHQCRLADGPGGEKLWLLKARGGTEMPVHGHRGTEMTLVLRGSYKVEGQQYIPGLLEIAGPEIEDHRPVIDTGEDCICLVVTEAPIRLHSLIGRLVQPFIGL